MSPNLKFSSLLKQYHTSSRSLVGLVATKSHACYLLGGTGWDWVRIPLGLNFKWQCRWRIWSYCLISQEWLASIAEGDSIINATLFILS